LLHPALATELKAPIEQGVKRYMTVGKL